MSRTVNADVVLAGLRSMGAMLADRDTMTSVKVSIAKRRIVSLIAQIEGQAEGSDEVRPNIERTEPCSTPMPLGQNGSRPIDWADGHPEPVPADEREALTQAIWHVYKTHDIDVIVDAVVAAGFRRQRPIGDAQLDAALGTWLAPARPIDLTERMYAALEAAQAVQS